MNILVINCHWNNRGDEAAIRSMLDELEMLFPRAMFYVQGTYEEFDRFFPLKSNIKLVNVFPNSKKEIVSSFLASVSNGLICLSKNSKDFYKVLKSADIVIHAPGGPSIGDLYMHTEVKKLWRLLLVRRSGVPYVFYAPSMGPFNNKFRNYFRKKVLKNASLICLREELSASMLKEFIPELNPIVTLDSAFQHDIDLRSNEKLFYCYDELNRFINGRKVIGITVTDLQWNCLYKANSELVDRIRYTFSEFVKRLVREGFKVLFIPQLFGLENDYDYMKSFALNLNEDTFVMSDQYDCYFQQYVISKLYAVIGMRYHSNIFSCKMGTPFISIAYEQKMLGFMTKAGFNDYCISIEDLSVDMLNSKFDYLLSKYDEFKRELVCKKDFFKKQAYMTTELVAELINKEIKID